MADLIGVVQAAKEFKIHPQTIRVWIHAGRIKGYKKPFSNAFLVDRAELKALSKVMPIEVEQGSGDQLVMPLEGKRKRSK